MRPLSARERRLVALGLLALALALVWLLLVTPVLAGFSARAAERDQLRATLARNERLLAALPQLRRAAELQRRTSGRFGLAAADAGQAREALKQRLATTLTSVGGAVASVQDLEAELPAGWVGARADATLTLSQLHESLRRLGNEEPYVAVEYISVGAGGGVSPTLEVRLEVSAPHRPPLARRP
jgi:hypothetical protein